MSVLPQPVDDVSIAFGGRMADLLPAWSDIPDEFKRFSGNSWVDLTSTWFYEGLPATTTFIPKDDVDAETAVRHLQAILRSWEPKHEHKTAGVAWLASLWFERVDGWKK